LNDYQERGKVDEPRLRRVVVAGVELGLYPMVGCESQFDRATLRWLFPNASAGLAGQLEWKKSWPFVIMAGPVPIPVYAKAAVEVFSEAAAQVMSLTPLSLNGDFVLDPHARGSLAAGVDEVFAVEGWVGGGAEMELQWPAVPRVRKASVYVNGGVKVYALLWKWENEKWCWRTRLRLRR
jgi:hypothetical protein